MTLYFEKIADTLEFVSII